MPLAAMKPCSKIGCGNLTRKRFCEKHTNSKRQYDHYRRSSTSRGYNYEWQMARKAFLRENPLCKYCINAGRVEASTVVDHIIPHRGDQVLFWLRSNWQALCKAHHDAKTAREDGGFGNEKTTY
ncbi:HNH endonuclease [Paenibacillus sp. strain BS8-2]